MAGNGAVSILDRHGYRGSISSWDRSPARNDAETESCGHPDERRHMGRFFHRNHGNICSHTAALDLVNTSFELLDDPIDHFIALSSRINQMVGPCGKLRESKPSTCILYKFNNKYWKISQWPLSYGETRY